MPVRLQLLPLLFFLFVLFFFTSCHCCTKLDRVSLLSFQLNISAPSSAPLNWSAAADCCLWEGITCNQDGWVTRLWLPSRGLRGGINSSIANLTFLSHLNLSYNHLSGSLSGELFSILYQRLEVLDLRLNSLSGELPSPGLFGSGPIPIRTADLSSNRFHGAIQSLFLQLARNLTSFNVSNNSFVGPIPSTICTNSPNLNFLDLSLNNFSGHLPAGFRACSQLEILRAGFNSLSGLLPNEIYSLTALRELSLPFNRFSGQIGDGVVDLPNLKVLELYWNEFNGTIPRNIGKLFNLKELLLHTNNLSGTLPPSLMTCRSLVTLNLRLNYLEGNISALDFSNLTHLTTLDLGNNNLTGTLPASLYSCKSLTAVRLANNRLEGQILPDILSLQSLSFLSLSNNKLKNVTEAIRILAGSKSLSTVILSRNFVDEQMPEDKGIVGSDGFQSLQVLSLGGCLLTGQVPAWLANLRKLEVLDLSVNRITGPIPSWLGALRSLFYIDLSENLISGQFPKELCALPALAFKQVGEEVDQSSLELPVFVMPNNATKQQYNQLSNLPPAIYLRNNSLNGNIPVEIGQLKFLLVLDLSHNDFSGEIPDQISNLTNLERLDFSYNNLSGQIPVTLKDLHFLSWFSVAHNDLKGEIPSGGQFDTWDRNSFEGNPGLCGRVLQRCASSGTFHPVTTGKGPNKKFFVGLTLGICFGIGFIFTLLTLCILSKRRILPRGDADKVELAEISCSSNFGVSPEVGKNTSLVMVFQGNANELKDLTISEILKATDDFNEANIIGCGGFGLVYRASLADGTKVAIKKLSGEFGLMEREFKAEVEALSTAQHKNLVSLQGYCVHEGSRLLIYSYMENGSLDYWLHEKTDGASQLDWPTRLKIARGVSNGVSYMHQVCEPHIVHRDIKSSNILLDEKFEAHVADFGLSRLILPYHTHVTTELVGTLGYIPPEYGQAWIATLRGDVYSLGVVMLELLTGKRPVELVMPKMSRELVGWVHQMRSEGKQNEVFDPLLRDKGFEEEMLQILDVACLCVNQDPFKRPTIKEVVDWLKNVGLNSPTLF